jgi:hypothetical protein
MQEYITDVLRDASTGTNSALLEMAADAIDSRDQLLGLMQDFLRQYDLIAEFESTLNYDERADYHDFFGLGDEERDPFIELDEIFGVEEEEDEW